MKITCQSCQSKYTVSDEKVQGKTVKIKCRKCGATILVNSSGAVAAPGGVADPVSAAGVSGDAATYMVNVGDGDQRSLSLGELVSLYQSGGITAETYVWAEGMADWQPLGQVESIVAALNGGAAAAPEAYGAVPAQAPVAQQGAVGGYGAAPAAAAAQPVYGAAQPQGYGAGQPQGYGAAAASEPVASAPRAARRDQARPSNDLFGAGGRESQRPSDDVATSAPLFSGGGGPGGAGGGAGRREENSVLFSLTALTSKSSTAAPTAPTAKTTARGDDSGLIDLKALASGAPAPAPAAALVPDDGGLFQLSAPIGAPASAAPSVAPIADLPPKNRGPLFVGIGVAVAGVAIAIAFFAAKGDDPQPQPTASDTPAVTQTTAPAAPPPSEPIPTAVDPGATAAASASASASAVAAAKAPTGGSRPAGGGTVKSSGGGSTTKSGSGAAPAATATTKAPAARGNCGCRADDLMCNMQCSAKGKK
ncbi:zinc-ribbon domain-containing protein [Chondromyces apiculatus]|uniref:Cell division protein FtsK n=1 Tax=Chondromyces apiculatus DSM 436 TaxID=1192034 RepID=A0A017SV16_9BACT|nr:zinc-ribbon domain-containing protein [Chondromyces apiculatus]EYF00824.1 Cell division protein FtsK [Chondromyces apiculatus DSM 436]